MAPTRIVLLPAGTVMPPHRKVPIPSTSRANLPSTSYPHPKQVKQSPPPPPRRIDPLELINPTPITKTRKRERLTALTADEKMARRKMKNRVAAQTARDRKKERTCGLEDAVKDLLDENRRLREENANLMERLSRLEEEAAARREGMHPSVSSFPSLSHPIETVATPLGSAASINELQQRAQAVTTDSTKAGMEVGTKRLDLLPIMMLLLCSLPSTSTAFWKTSETSTSTKCAPLSTKVVSRERRQRLASTLYRLISKRRRPIPRRPP
ncbi:hypothetical protein PMAYCL1PPCAC_11869 [Pristionchus mayeri]|uniref:X-box-binding protein 1 n=1 Tax=Pristionchus mayeri TaxID=1317129 RepID=A0AAN5CFT4_9BILA|nr:hypothetical protein PMAYCL1PPCAC_11869 [Pristionchus mayeri]